jgi:hypothetical protein
VAIGQLLASDGRWFDNDGRVLCDPDGIMMHTPDPNALGAKSLGPTGVGCFSPAVENNKRKLITPDEDNESNLDSV